MVPWLFELVAGGHLHALTAWDDMFRAACDAGLPESEIKDALRWGAKQGMANPRSKPGSGVAAA
jgi:hypothetical protein